MILSYAIAAEKKGKTGCWRDQEFPGGSGAGYQLELQRIPCTEVCRPRSCSLPSNILSL